MRHWFVIGALGLSLSVGGLAHAEEQKPGEAAPEGTPFPLLGEEALTTIPTEAALGGTFTFAWPLDHVRVNSPFGVRRDPLKKKKKARLHAGVDLDGEVGDTVMACGPGMVLYAGWNAGYGNYVLIQHANGYRSHYGHLSEVLVFRGQMVRQGAPLGLVGNTGRSTGPHLHFGVTKGEKWVNPEKLIKRNSATGALDPDSDE